MSFIANTAFGRWPAADAGSRPLVSVVLPIRNEADHIEACLERLIRQAYPADRLEILVVDGRSDDGTRDVVRQVQARHPDARIRLLDNPERVVPPALNAGIRAARGEVIVRMDGHSVPSDDYVARCVEVLAETGAANAGGVVEPTGATRFGEAVALATGHPLGAGDARYRIGGAPGDVDTVMLGAFRRDVFAKVGLFDESMVRDQDYEMNVRIRKAGERIRFDPRVRFRYTPRGTLRGLWQQYFEYGWWKGETWRRHRESFRWRQLVPPAFVAGMLGLTVAAPWLAAARYGWIVAAAVYLATVLAVSVRLARPPVGVGAVAAAFGVLHVAYGLGVVLWLATAGRYPYRADSPRVPRLREDEVGREAEVSA